MIKQESYAYDSNGNILSLSKIGNQSENYLFEYDGDRLLRVKKNGNVTKSISYDPNNVFYPCSMTIKGTNQNLSWQGKRLTNIGDNIEYKYNQDGMRIYKKSLLEETIFELEGINIFSLTKSINNVSYNFGFVYDHKGFLSALIYNKKPYFYVRDITGTILGTSTILDYM